MKITISSERKQSNRTGVAYREKSQMINESDINRIRSQFPLISGKDIAYLDNAATTQKPLCVLDAERKYYEESNANPLRGVYELSTRATEEYENARAKVARFINAADPSEIVFTRNATESLNLIAFSYGLGKTHEGDEIAVSVMEHHSNFLPWKMVCERTGATLVKIECDPEGNITDEELDRKIGDKTKIVAVTALSNVLGRKNDIKRIAKKAHEVGAVMVADGAQSVPHMGTDVQDMDADFLVFSGHKMYSAMGIGALYGKKKILDDMDPFLRGGEMIETVHWDKVRYAQVPHKFEAGTVNAGGAVSLGAAIDFIESIGINDIGAREHELTKYAMWLIKDIPGVQIVGSKDPEDHLGIVTFTVDDVHPHDVADILGNEGVCIRAGHHCAQPLMDHLGLKSTSRASFAFYNTKEEVDRFIDSLSKVRGLMGYK